MKMLKEEPDTKKKFSPQYFIINNSEPQYALIKKHLLATDRCPDECSHYFIRTDSDNGCVCRIKASNGTILFYEILNHLQEGISDEDIRQAIMDPINSSPIQGYFYIPPKIREKLHTYHLSDHAYNTNMGKKESFS